MKQFLIACLLCCFCLDAGAQYNPPRFFSLDTLQTPRRLVNWLCHDGDDLRWAAPDFDDSGWKHSVKGEIDVKTDTPIRFSGIAWFRKRIRIDSSLVGVPLAIRIRQDGASQIFLDGDTLTQYGTVAPRNNAKYFNPQGEPFPFVFREAGDHVLAIRYAEWGVHQTAERWGEHIISFSVILDRAESAIVEQKFVTLVTVGVGIGLAILFGTLGFIHLILWLYYRSARSNLLFALLSISLAVLFYFLVLRDTANNPAKVTWTGRLYPYVALLSIIALSGFINTLFARRKLRFRIIAALGILSAVALAVPFEVPGAGEFPLLLFMVVILETIVLTVWAIYKKIPGARIIGAGVLLFSMLVFVGVIVGVLTGGLNLRLNPTDSPILFPLAAASILAIPISMSAYLAWNFATVSKRLKAELAQVEMLSEKTRQQEEERQRLLETRQEELEREVALRTEQLRGEKQKSDTLLLNILPEEVADELKEKGTAQARLHNNVSVLFTDFVDFTRYSEQLSPAQIVEELDGSFKAFDAIIERHGLEKIKTIGDAYMAVAGLPLPHPDAAAATVRAALDIRDYIAQRRRQYLDSFDIRIGVHSGAVVAGIIGVKKFAYDVWGDTVNTAARMEQSGEPGKVNISTATHDMIAEKFSCTYRGEVAAKGKGAMGMWFVEAAL